MCRQPKEFCDACSTSQIARKLVAELTDGTLGRVNVGSLRVLVGRHVNHSPLAAAFSEAFVASVGRWTASEMLDILRALPPSSGACANALRAWPHMAAHVASVDRMADGVLEVLRGTCSDYAVRCMIVSIPPRCMTAELASRLAFADFRTLAHFTTDQARCAGARPGLHMHTVVDVRAARESAARRSLASQQAVLEGAWASPTFCTVADFVDAHSGNICMASVASLGGWRALPTFVDQASARFWLSFRAVCDAPTKRAPCTVRGLSRRTMRWFATYGDAASYDRVGKRAVERNACEGLLLWAMRRCTEPTHPAVRRVKALCGDGGGTHALARRMTALLWDGTGASDARARFVSGICWRLGTDHVARVLDYTATPFARRSPWRLLYARSHAVVASMPPATQRWVRVVLACLRRCASDRSVAHTILSFVRWRDTRRRAWPRCAEHCMHDFDYT